jgi:hypothetical protein
MGWQQRGTLLYVHAVLSCSVRLRLVWACFHAADCAEGWAPAMPAAVLLRACLSCAVVTCGGLCWSDLMCADLCSCCCCCCCYLCCRLAWLPTRRLCLSW